MEMVGAILFAVLLYVITTELWRLVARRSRRAVLQRSLYLGGPKLKLLYSGERLQNVTAVTDAPNRFLARDRASMEGKRR
jgi:hypothetical protein